MPSMREEWVDARAVYEGRIFRIRAGSIRMEDGAEAQREMVEHPGGAAVLPVCEDGVLLVRQFRIAAGRDVLEVPAGKLEPGDEPERRARLELEEETGYLAGSLIAAGTVLATPGYSSERIHLFLAFELERVGQRLEEDERIEVVRLSFEELYRLADRGGIEDAKTLLAIHALRRRAT